MTVLSPSQQDRSGANWRMSLFLVFADALAMGFVSLLTELVTVHIRKLVRRPIVLMLYNLDIWAATLRSGLFPPIVAGCSLLQWLWGEQGPFRPPITPQRNMHNLLIRVNLYSTILRKPSGAIDSWRN